MFSLVPRRRQENSIFDFMNDMEKSFFGNDLTGINQFRTDIVEKDDAYILEAELPGFSKEEIEVNINDDYMTIQATHREESSEEKDNYVRRERKYGSFSRSFNLDGINADDISAKYEDGILKIDLPKLAKEDIVPPSRQIDIK